MLITLNRLVDKHYFNHWVRVILYNIYLNFIGMSSQIPPIMEEKVLKSTGCCDPFNPEPWQEKEIVWENKLFVHDTVSSFMHVPLNFSKKVVKNVKLIEEANAKSPVQLMLTDELSLWKSHIYINVSGEVKGAGMVNITGTFLTKVFEGSYNKSGSWVKEMKNFVKSRGKELKKLYFSYTTCPACAKTYGKNYVVLFAQIA